jgi:hypothetical protein
LKSLHQFSQDLRRLPRVVAQKVAEAAAPVITELANKSFDASETPYGAAWKLSKKGQKVTLRKSGDLAKYIRYVAIGTKLRVALGVRYAKYQIGTRPVYPKQVGDLPPSYVQALERVAVRVVKEELAR